MSNLMGVNDFPKEVVKGMYALVEYKGTEREHFVYAYSSEVEAFKISKEISHNDKTIFKANITYADIYGMKVMCGYEEI